MSAINLVANILKLPFQKTDNMASHVSEVHNCCVDSLQATNPVAAYEASLGALSLELRQGFCMPTGPLIREA